VTRHYARFTHDPDYQRTVLRYEIARDLMLLSARRLQRLLDAKANFNPAQPRVPAGNSDGGQWTNAGGGSAARQDFQNFLRGNLNGKPRLSQEPQAQVIPAQFYPGHPERYKTVLEDEEARGGHTISEHVSKSPDQLIRDMNITRTEGLFVTTAMKRNGSFPSIEAANKLINSTLSQNQIAVDLVADGIKSDDFITARFSSKTGIEAFAASERTQPYIRDTYGVGVSIVHDKSSPKGYTIVTAYPRND
jgi:hypothetical protein